jgi:hypothetical protein
MTKSISTTSTITVIVATIFAFAFIVAFASTAFAGKPNGPAAVNGLAHPGAVNQLELYEKDANWDPVVGGANGRVTFGEEGFVFNGHGLNAKTDYTLLRYEGVTWPTVECLASGTTNNGGNINLAGDDFGSYGDKVWLVLSDDVDCDSDAMIGWNPAEYLFEYNLI